MLGMDAETFRRWAASLGLNKSAAAAKLGIGRGAIARYWEGQVSIPRHVGLACSAVAMGLKPWGTQVKEARE